MRSGCDDQVTTPEFAITSAHLQLLPTMSFMQLILCLPRIGYSSLVWVIAFIFRHFPTWRPARSIYGKTPDSPFTACIHALRQIRKMNVIGLLGTTNLPEDWWIATDFLVWKHLLSDAHRAEWYSGVDFDSSSFSVILGDPCADRLRFNLDQTGITLVPEVPSIKTDFLFGVAEMLEKVDKEDIAVIVICSNCELNGDVRLGGGSQVLEHLRRRHLERSAPRLPNSRREVVCCFYGPLFRPVEESTLDFTRCSRISPAIRRYAAFGLRTCSRKFFHLDYLC
ncbi:hypothetical protein MVEN_02453100 [Mycena venus]|uniref:Uncharacterized protein n=1 Tax=Mycena venus TaxID=2733690 RepID=A0A8H6WWY7_9AGAR|nr:hypothetical protein MVEN_02453100 [Mycena venus]